MTDGRSNPRLTPRVVAAIVGGLTVLGLALRLQAAGDSLAGDEIFLYYIVHGRGLGRALELVHDTESTPPLHFILAWASDRIGSSETWIRLPSVVFGTATIPLVYMLGSRTVGRSAGLVAAALVAISPFAVYYGSQGRAYALLAFLSVTSTLALVEASRSGKRGWWALFALAALASLYTHYTAVFVVAAQFVWALVALRHRWRAVALSGAAVVLLYVPWIPAFLVQSEDSAEQRIEAFGASISSAVVQTFPGGPFGSASDLPGSLPLVALGLILVASVGVLLRDSYLRGASDRLRPAKEVVLVIGVAAAAPLGAWLYTLGPTSIFIPRNLSSSFPAFCVVIGALLTAAWRPPWRTVAVGATLLVVAIGSVKMLGDKFHRPDFRETATYLESVAPPGAPIVSQLGSLDERALAIYLDGDHRLVHYGSGADADAWKPAARGEPVFVVRPQGGLFFGVPKLAGPGSGFVLRGSRRFSGTMPLIVGRYSGRTEGTIDDSGGQRRIDWSFGRGLEVSDSAARGFIDDVSETAGKTAVTGWATDAANESPADWVLIFGGDRLLAAGVPNQIRPDLVEAFGPSAVNAGFQLEVDSERLKRAPMHVFAVSGGAASELKPAP